MRDFFTKDVGWKLLSLFLAVGIWLTVHKILTETPIPVTGDNTTNSDIATPIIYSNRPIQVVSAAGDVHLYRVAPDEVTVTLTGPAGLMGNLQASQIRVVVDLTETNTVPDGWRRVEISAPAGVTLIGVTPSRVLVIPPPKQ